MGEPISIGYAIIAAIVFSLSYYLKKEHEKFRWAKLIGTGLTGAIVGVIAFISGVTEVSEEYIILQMGFFVGVVSLLTAWIKIAFRWIRKNFFSD